MPRDDAVPERRTFVTGRRTSRAARRTFGAARRMFRHQRRSNVRGSDRSSTSTSSCRSRCRRSRRFSWRHASDFPGDTRPISLDVSALDNSAALANGHLIPSTTRSRSRRATKPCVIAIFWSSTRNIAHSANHSARKSRATCGSCCARQGRRLERVGAGNQGVDYARAKHRTRARSAGMANASTAHSNESPRPGLFSTRRRPPPFAKRNAFDCGSSLVTRASSTIWSASSGTPRPRYRTGHR